MFDVCFAIRTLYATHRLTVEFSVYGRAVQVRLEFLA